MKIWFWIGDPETAQRHHKTVTQKVTNLEGKRKEADEEGGRRAGKRFLPP